MEKKVLFIDNKDSFLIRTIRKDLEEADYNCQTAALDVQILSKIKDNLPELMVLCVEPEIASDMQALIFLRDLCIDDGHRLAFVGYEEDIKEVKKIISSEYVAGEFLRPINAKQAVEEVKRIVENSSENSNKKHILIVDDSGTMLNTIKSWLEGKYRISMVNSALNAISFLANNTPDLILLDYEMPVCTGPQLLEMIRSDIKTQDVPVIFLTAKGDRESVMRVLSLRAQGYLLKSMPRDHITSEIDAFFEKLKAGYIGK